MSRDQHRSAVYRAEDLIFSDTLFAEPLGAAGILSLAAMLGETPWFEAVGQPFDVVPTRRESRHSYARTDNRAGVRAQLRLSLHQEDAATLAHEAAHLIARRHGAIETHGPEFRSADLDVTALLCGTIAADRLARAFAEAGLAVAPRCWDPPSPLSDRGLYGRWRVARFTSSPNEPTSQANPSRPLR